MKRTMIKILQGLGWAVLVILLSSIATAIAYFASTNLILFFIFAVLVCIAIDLNKLVGFYGLNEDENKAKDE